VWKTISWSPYANAVVFIDGDAATAPASITFTVLSRDSSDDGAWTITLGNDNLTGYKFVQDELLTSAGIAVHPYGAFMWDGINHGNVTVTSKPTVKYMGATYVAAANFITTAEGKYVLAPAVGATLTFNKQ
jgi:hypothetical protein